MAADHIAKGFRNAKALAGGLDLWKRVGYPTEKLVQLGSGNGTQNREAMQKQRHSPEE